MYKRYHDFLIRDWTPADRDRAAAVIGQVLTEFGLGWEPKGADQDVIEVEAFYTAVGGQFWVIEQDNKLVGTAAFYPLRDRPSWVEIRKMYLLPHARNRGLGQFLLIELESQIWAQDFQTILLETSTQLPLAMKLYERNHYLPYSEIGTARCDRAYIKIKERDWRDSNARPTA